MGKLEGKVAFISGAARGMGRAFALRLAEEGADIIGLDICDQLPTVTYAMSTPADLDETARQVQARGRRMVARRGDVRDLGAVRATLADGVAELGRVDIVLPNAGIATMLGEVGDTEVAWADSIDVMLTGVFHMIRAAAPALIEQGDGGAIVITSSTGGLKGLGDSRAGTMGYVAAKHGVVGLMRAYANELAPHNIRVNTVHPTGCNTPMVVNEQFAEYMEESAGVGENLRNALPVELIEPRDVANAIAWLCSEEGRYVTGVTLPVDAGVCVR